MSCKLVKAQPSSKFPLNTVVHEIVGLSFVNITGNVTVTSSGVAVTLSRLNPPWSFKQSDSLTQLTE